LELNKVLFPIGGLCFTAGLIGLIIVKGLGLQACSLLVLVGACALMRTWQKYRTAPL